MLSLKDAYDHYFVSVVTPITTFFQRIFSYGKKKKKGQWDIFKNFKPEEFSKELNLMPYKEDRILGIKLDSQMAFQDPNLFFEPELNQRDCLPTYEKVYTDKGIKQINELSIGDRVLSYNFKINLPEYRPVTNIWKTGKKDVFRVYFKNGTFSDSSADHKFFNRVNEKGKSKYVEKSLFEIQNMDRGKSHCFRNKIACVKKVPYTPIDIEWLNEDLCFVIGHYFAEGFCEKRWVNTCQVRTCGYDIPEYIIPKLKKNNIPYSLYFNKKGLPIVTFLKSEFKDYLFSLKKNSFEFTIPNELKMLPERKLQAILDGHFLGDGHLNLLRTTSHKKPRKEYTTSSKDLADFIMEASWRIGNPLLLYFQKNHMGVGKMPIYRIYDLASRFKKDYGYSELSEVSIKKIELLPKQEEMIDIEVADNHNFFLASSGTLVHNCDDFSGMWYHYGKHHKGKLFLGGVVITIHEFGNKENTYHMTTILFDLEDKCILCDYTYGPVFDNFLDAITYLKAKYNYKNDSIVWVKVRSV